MGKTETRAGTAGIITTDGASSTQSLQTLGFGVFGYMKGTNGATSCYSGSSPSWTWENATPNFMYNEQVTYAASKWSYTPIKYWPNDFSTSSVDAADPAATGSVDAGKLSFFAYAPYVTATAATGVVTPTTEGITGLSSNNANTEPWVTYKFAKTGDPAKYNLTTTSNVDLLWGTRITDSYDKAAGGTIGLTGYQDAEGNYYNTDLTKQKTAETVDFNFKHALAKFGGNDGTRCGMQVVADFDLNDGTPAESPSSDVAANQKPTETLITLNRIKIENMTAEGDKFAIGGKFNLATGTWSEHVYADANELSTTYTVASTGANAAVWEPATPALTYSDGWQQSSQTFAGIDHTFKDVFSSAADALYFIPGGNCKLKITVQYTVRTFDDGLVSLGSGETTSTKIVQEIANVVNFTSLKPNHFYKLIIHLGLTSVKFAAVVSSWDNTTSGNDDTQFIWLPSNTVTP